MLGLILLAAAAQTAAVPADYRDDANWLCRPGRADACAPDATRTVVARDGTMRAETVARDSAPKADCFYVYPTASLDPGDNSDMVPGVEERGQAASQVAAFAQVCRIFAPVYRQVTLTAWWYSEDGSIPMSLLAASLTPSPFESCASECLSRCRCRS